MDKTSADKKSMQRTDGEKYDLQRAEIEKKEFLKPYTHGRPWDKAQCSLEIDRLYVVVKHDIFELGCRLIEAKANIPHGQWLPYLKERKIDRYTAAHIMRVTVRLADKPRLRAELKGGIDKFKIYTNADDSDLEAYELSGTLLGKDKDALNAMSRDEVRDLVLKKDRRLEQAKEQLAELQTQVERLQNPDCPEEQIYEDLQNLRQHLFNTLEQYKNAAKIGFNNKRSIALYTIYNMISLQAISEMQDLEENSNLGKLLQGTVKGYDPTIFDQVNLQEHSNEQTQELSLVDKPEETD